MIWMQRLVAVVFVIGIMALVLAIALLIRQSDEPSLTILVGLVGAAALILLSGGCIALVSIAISARKCADSLARLSHRGESFAPVARASHPLPTAAQSEPVQDEAIRPTRAQGKPLVAER